MLLDQGIVSKEELEHYFALLEDPAFLLAGILLRSAWGRTPG